jgi:competence protein ComEC
LLGLAFTLALLATVTFVLFFWAKSRLWVIFLGLALGVSWHLIWAHSQLDKGLPVALEGEPLVVEGVVIGLPLRRDRGQSFTFDITQSEQLAAGSKLRLNHYGNLSFVPGERWRVRVKLKQLHGYSNPGVPDREAIGLRQGIAATGYISDWGGNRLLGKRRLSLSALRHSIATRLTDSLDGSPVSGLIRALTVGDSSGISQSQRSIISSLGLNHLFVISGLHVGLITVLIFNAVFLLARIGVRSKRLSTPICAATAAVLTAGMYSSLAGWSISTQRAFLMALTLLLPYLLGRQYSASLRFLLALLIVLMLDPLATTDKGFWLSFSAVGILLFFSSSYKNIASQQGFSFIRLCRPQLHVFLGLLAPLLILVQSVSLVAPVVNLVAIPVVGFIITPLALLGMLAMIVEPAMAQAILGIAASMLSLMLNLFSFLSTALGQSSQWAPAIHQTGVLSFLLLVSLILLLPPQLRLYYLIVPLSLPVLVGIRGQQGQTALRLDVFDVGQGLAILLRTANHSLLYDTGPAYGEDFNLGQAVIVPAARSLGVSSLDRIMVSHFDSDHSGGLQSILTAYPDAKVSAGKGAGAGIESCVAGQNWRWDEVEFTVLHGVSDEPDSPTQAVSLNDGSCVLLVNVGLQSVLLPGDISRKVERKLAATYGGHLQANVLIAAHHGSDTSSGYPLLKTTLPQYGIFSAGYKNGYGHPHQRVLSRFSSLDIATLASFEAGMISFELTGSGIVSPPEAYRCSNRRYWSWSGNHELCRYL